MHSNLDLFLERMEPEIEEQADFSGEPIWDAALR
jgi:hypothetical protein